MNIRNFAEFIIAVAMVAGLLCTGTAQGEVLSTKDFTAKVEGAGGAVDFIFEEDRPHAECHASTIVQAADGSLLSAWFGGTEEKNPDVAIWYSHYADGKWGTVEKAAKVDDTAHWNPVLFRDEDDTVHLFFKIGPEIKYWQTYWMSTSDAGKNWSAPTELVADDKGGRGPVRNKPIILSDGAWLAPASTELKGWKPFADRSVDKGKTWTRSEDFGHDRKKMKALGAIQPTFWESAPGKVHALLRSTNGWVWRSNSEDHGKTWTEMEQTDLPNNNSGIDGLLLDDGRLLLVYNPVGDNWGERTPLDLAVSDDNGKTWESIAHLEDDPAEGNEFSYPAIVKTEDGIAITYTWNRERIRAWQIPMDVLK